MPEQEFKDQLDSQEYQPNLAQVELEQEEFVLPFLEAEDELLDKVRKLKHNTPWTHSIYDRLTTGQI